MTWIELDDAAKQLVGHLAADVFNSGTLLQSTQGSQFGRRTMIRSFFAFVEGFGRVTREAILNSDRATSLPEDVRIALQDRTVRIAPTGRVSSTDGRQPFSNLFAATLRAWASLDGWSDDRIQSEIFADAGWETFVAAVHVRNRLMHPRLAHSLEIDDEEMEQVHRSFNWVLNRLLRLLGFTTVEIERLVQRPAPE